jgi:predicted Co/Zn/Cd cation transporter (cation efflux family)
MESAGRASGRIRDVKVKAAVAWALLAALLGVFVSIPAFVVVIALTQIAAGLVRVKRDNDRYDVEFWLTKHPIQSVLLLMQGGVFVALAIAAFLKANTSLIAILAG